MNTYRKQMKFFGLQQQNKTKEMGSVHLLRLWRKLC